MAMIRINDTTLHYEREGQGPPILFVHGLCGDADVWADQAHRFSDRYTCVRYDRRGHSRSARGDATISYTLHADDTAALIEALELTPCLLVGSSSGAAIAVDVALRYGHLLRGVVLSEPPLFRLDAVAGDVAMQELSLRLEPAMATGDPRAGVDAFFSFMCPGLWSTLDEAGKDRYRANADIGFTDLRSQSLDITPARLSAIHIPALVIAGTTSHPSLRSIARQLVAAWPDARFVELEGCGHVTYAERPDAFAHAVSVFAAELDRRLAIAPDEKKAMRRGTTAEPRIERFDVRATDGTPLAVWVDGDGPPLVLVHGSMCDHTVFDELVDHLRDHVTVFSMDRRGFGASGDAPGYSIEHDFDDVVAVVDAVAARTGRKVALWGHSYGANCAMGGAARTTNVGQLVLYEPSLGLAYAAGSIEAIEEALAADDREAAILAVLVGILEMSDEEIEARRPTPRWATLLAGAPTVARECRAEDSWVYRPGQFDGVTAPTLVLLGSETPPAIEKTTREAVTALPDARIRVLDGHGHLAVTTDPAFVAGIIREFISS